MWDTGFEIGTVDRKEADFGTRDFLVPVSRQRIARHQRSLGWPNGMGIEMGSAE
jgi:hypothetical protein